ncbi:hypothetical protein L6R53_09255 [Myxococcota bacterium]|nr:hypothetical protein [Myxococcota bacterium]
MPGNASTLVPVDRLVLDPLLQCRAAVDQEVVDAYAELLTEGARFPPISVIEADDQLLVTDGWHRALAHRKAERKEIEAEIHPGTRRDALLAAVKANSDHGLQRSTRDKRRAVRLLLADAEWCRLSSRDLAPLAGVSHAFINQARKRYGLKPGVLLTDERIEEVDGELPEVWRALMAKASPYEQAALEAIRTERSPRKLRGDTWGQRGAAFDQRRKELARSAWPWPEDETEEARAARWATLDTVDDIEAALRSADLPGGDLAAGYALLDAALEAPNAGTWAADRLRRALDGRPRLLAELEDAVAKSEAHRQADPFSQARAIVAMPEPSAQAEAVRQADARVLNNLAARQLHPEVRDGVYRARVVGDAVETCPHPHCDGWVRPGNYPTCMHCGNNPDHLRRSWTEGLRAAAWLLEASPDHGMLVAGVRVDATAIRILAALEDIGVHELPPALCEAVQAWRAASPATVIAAHEEEEQADKEEDQADEGSDDLEAVA